MCPASVRKVGQGIGKALTTEALVFNRQSKNFQTFYNTCCPYRSISFTPSSLAGAVGGTGQLSISGLNMCSGVFDNLTLSGTYFSDNTSIATVNTIGSVSYMGPGSTDEHSSVEFFEMTFPGPICVLTVAAALIPTDVISVSVSLSPATVPPEAATTVTVTVLPAQVGRSVSMSVEEVPNSGGHQHLGRPLGSFGSSSGTTDSQGKFTTTYTASQFGGAETITASSGSASGSATLSVVFPGLSLLGAGANYDLIGPTTEHPVNHYGNSLANGRTS